MKKLQQGRFCKVNGNLFGKVEYVCDNGFYGIQLLGETRVDEWNPVQVEAVSNEEAVMIAKELAKKK